jgi:hypothetical protein
MREVIRWVRALGVLEPGMAAADALCQLAVADPRRQSAFVAAVKRNKVAPQVAKNLEPLLAELKPQQRRRMAVVSDRVGELVAAFHRRVPAMLELWNAVLPALEEWDIPFVVVKGGPPMAALYPLESPRQMWDIDLLVPNEEAAWGALRAMTNQGLSLADSLTLINSAGPESPRLCGQVAVVQERAGELLALEVNFGGFCPTSATRLQIDYWSRRRFIWTGVRRWPTLTPEDQILMTVVHALGHGYFTLKDVNDYHLLTGPGGLDTAYLATASKVNGLEPLLDALRRYHDDAYGPASGSDPGFPADGLYHRLRSPLSHYMQVMRTRLPGWPDLSWRAFREAVRLGFVQTPGHPWVETLLLYLFRRWRLVNLKTAVTIHLIRLDNGSDSELGLAVLERLTAGEVPAECEVRPLERNMFLIACGAAEVVATPAGILVPSRTGLFQAEDLAAAEDMARRLAHWAVFHAVLE